MNPELVNVAVDATAKLVDEPLPVAVVVVAPAFAATTPVTAATEPGPVVTVPDTPTLPPVMFEFVDTVFPTLTVPDTGTVPEIWAVNAVELESGQMAATVSAGSAVPSQVN